MQCVTYSNNESSASFFGCGRSHAAHMSRELRNAQLVALTCCMQELKLRPCGDGAVSSLWKQIADSHIARRIPSSSDFEKTHLLLFPVTYQKLFHIFFQLSIRRDWLITSCVTEMQIFTHSQLYYFRFWNRLFSKLVFKAL